MDFEFEIENPIDKIDVVETCKEVARRNAELEKRKRLGNIVRILAMSITGSILAGLLLIRHK